MLVPPLILSLGRWKTSWCQQLPWLFVNCQAGSKSGAFFVGIASGHCLMQVGWRQAGGQLCLRLLCLSVAESGCKGRFWGWASGIRASGKRLHAASSPSWHFCLVCKTASPGPVRHSARTAACWGKGWLRNSKAAAGVTEIFSHKYSLSISDCDEIIKVIGSCIFFFENKISLKTCRDLLPFQNIIEN